MTGFFRVPDGSHYWRIEGETYTKVMAGESITVRELLNIRLFRPLNDLIASSPWRKAMREKCVRYALDSGAQGWAVINDAERIEKYIRSGRQ